MKKENNIEEQARQLRILLAEKSVRSGELAEAMGKSKQWISNLLNPQQIGRRQLEAIEFLKNMK
jgi:hypothetical protein